MNGVFIGLSTVDIVHSVERDPKANEKAAALSTHLFCGGPAANAAITFAKLGGHAELISRVGSHPLASVIHVELAHYGVALHDLSDGVDSEFPSGSGHGGRQVSRWDEPPVVASVVLNTSNGNRTVVGVKPQAQSELFTALPELLARPDIVLIDSYFSTEAHRYVSQARNSGVPVVLDGGSWKDSLPQVLPFVDYAICSERFRAPGCNTPRATAHALFDSGVAVVCFTRGERPILVFERSPRSARAEREIRVPAVPAVRDTLAAGDIFHGAFCYYLARDGGELDGLLSRASEIAARSVQGRGPRDW